MFYGTFDLNNDNPFNAEFDLNFDNFPRITSPFGPLIAPFWADFNFRDIFYRVSQDAVLLHSVEERISVPGFKPTLVIVVTWFQGRLHQSTEMVGLLI